MTIGDRLVMAANKMLEEVEALAEVYGEEDNLATSKRIKALGRIAKRIRKLSGDGLPVR